MNRPSDIPQWQPIETAPRDGGFCIAAKKANWVKGFHHFPYPLKQRWNGKKWEADDGKIYYPQPTHWMPLPNPPRQAARDGE